MQILDQEDGPVVAARDFPTNRGGLCRKGWSATALLHHPERLASPLMRDRKDTDFYPVSWEVALDRIARDLQAIQARDGRDAVGIFGGGGLTNEKAYLLGKFARVGLRTANIDYNGRFCMSSAAAAGIRAFGVDRGLPFPIADIARAEVILLVGSNLAETMPPVMQYFEEQRRRGGKLIIVDPRATATSQAATLHLQLTPGSDGALANGLLHLVINKGWVDQAYVDSRTEGFAAVRQAVAAYWPDRVERMTGVPSQQLHAVVELLGRASSVMILTARGAEQQSKGVDNTQAFINLALALGAVGRPYSGYGCLTGQGNGQGGREHGQKADQLPGYRRLDNPAHRAYVAGVWGVEPESLPGPGRSAYELLDTLGQPGGVRGLLMFGSNPVVSAPRAAHVEERMRALDLLVVSDFFLSETARIADVVLPCAQWAEESGTITNLEGRVLLRQQACDPPAGVRNDLEIIAGLAERLGCGQHFPSEPYQIFEELRRASAGGVADYAGISYERIAAEDGVFWPCPGENHPGTPRLFQERFPTESGRARFIPVQYRPPAEEPDTDYPFYLTTGRVMQHYQSGTQTRRVKELNQAIPQAFVEIHPALAGRYGIVDGDMVQLATRRGAAIIQARLTTTIRLDTLFVPFHWGDDACINRLTNPALDPISRMPEFKVCSVRVEKLIRT